MIRTEAKTALSTKLNLDLAAVIAGRNDLFSESDLNDALQTGVQLAWDYQPWTFTQEALTITLSADDLSSGYIDYPNTFEDSSIYLLTVNGTPWGKRSHRSYVAYFAENPTSDTAIWADYKRLIFMNAASIAVGDEVVLYGKLRSPSLSSDNDKLPFSPEYDNDETSGNRAIVNLAYAEILASEKKHMQPQAEAERKKAYATLDLLWRPMNEREGNEQNQDMSFFHSPDFFAQGGTSISQF